MLADIVLPVNTKLEEDDIAGDIFSGQYNLLYPEHKCIEPLAESYSDYEIVCMLADKLGLLKEYTGGKNSRADQVWLGDIALCRSRQLGRSEQEGLLRCPNRRRMGRRACRLL